MRSRILKDRLSGSQPHEPDHAGSVERLLELNPGLKIIATGCAIGFLKEIVNGEFTAIPVKDNETMKIGNKTLRF